MNLKNLPLHSVFTPASESRAIAESPLLVVLHGRGDSPAGFSGLPALLELPTLNYLFLQAPDEYYGGYSWYDMPPNQLPGILRSRELLEATFEKIFDEGFQPSRTILFGFSQGSLMTLEFGGRYPCKLRGYIGISGYVYDPKLLAMEANPQVKNADWLITHGTQDDVLEVGRTRAQIAELKTLGFQIDYREYPKSHTLDDLVEIPFLRGWIQARI